MSVALSLPSDEDAPAAASAWLEHHCLQRGLGGQLTAQIVGAVVEAVNNASGHRDQAAGGTITLRLYRGRDLWVIQVRDGNAEVDWPAGPTTAAPDPLQVGGRGLFIMEAWMDAVRYRRAGTQNIISLVKCLDKRIR